MTCSWACKLTCWQDIKCMFAWIMFPGRSYSNWLSLYKPACQGQFSHASHYSMLHVPSLGDCTQKRSWGQSLRDTCSRCCAKWGVIFPCHWGRELLPSVRYKMNLTTQLTRRVEMETHWPFKDTSWWKAATSSTVPAGRKGRERFGAFKKPTLTFSIYFL